MDEQTSWISSANILQAVHLSFDLALEGSGRFHLWNGGFSRFSSIGEETSLA